MWTKCYRLGVCVFNLCIGIIVNFYSISILQTISKIAPTARHSYRMLTFMPFLEESAVQLVKPAKTSPSFSLLRACFDTWQKMTIELCRQPRAGGDVFVFLSALSCCCILLFMYKPKCT